MKRWTFRIVLCLLLGVAPGALTTVGVAWALAIFVPNLHMSEFEMNGEPSSVGFRAPPFGANRKSIMLGRGVNWRTLWMEYPYADDRFSDYDSGNVFFVDLIQYGWPLVALESFSVADDPMIPGAFTLPAFVEEVGGLCVGSVSETRPCSGTYLPLRPILPGFLINTLFYAVIWFGLFFGIGALRRRIRRGRGRCEKCGYDLRGTPDDVVGCSECGWNRDPRKS